MANFTEIKTGGWVDNDPLSGDQISSFQDNMLKTPNFSEGSTHTPTAVIQVLGSTYGMYIEKLEAGDFKCGATTITSGTNSRITSLLLMKPCVINDWGTVEESYASHDITQGNVIIALSDTYTPILDLLNTHADEGDSIRVTVPPYNGTVSIHFNGTDSGITIAAGEQKTFTYMTINGWTYM